MEERVWFKGFECSEDDGAELSQHVEQMSRNVKRGEERRRHQRYLRKEEILGWGKRNVFVIEI